MYVAQSVKNPPANAGNMGSIPGSGNPLEKEMVTHSLTPVFLPGKSHGQSSLTGYSLGVARVALSDYWYHLYVEAIEMLPMNLFTKQK